MTFEQYLDRFMGADEHVELIKGVPVERMATQWDHEMLQVWMLRLLGTFVEEHNLGVVVGSRSAVKIDQFGGRLPDLLFISHDRMTFVEQRAIYGAPNLVIEIRSPGDNPSDIASLEADYRSIGVPEIWFIDPRAKSVRALRKRVGDYDEVNAKSGVLRSETVTGFWVELDWLFKEPRLTVRKALETIEGNTNL